MKSWDFEDAWKRSEPPDQPSNVTQLPIDPERGSRYAMAALQGELLKLWQCAEGTRNDTLNRAGFALAQLIAAGHIDATTVRTSLSMTARTRGLTEAEIDKTLASSLGAGGKQPRVIEDLPVPEVTVLGPTDGVTTADQADDGHSPEATASSGDGSSVRERFPIIDWYKLWEDEGEEEWIVEPLIPARRLVALFSPPKAGKSLLMLEIAVGVSLGIDVLGYRPERPRRVLYVDFENDPRGDIRERLRAMGYKPDDLQNLAYMSYPRLAKLDTAFGAMDLMAAVQDYDPELVVIDTISRAVGGEENDNDTWLNFYRHTGMTLKAAGVACVRLDHTGKDHDKGMRGGSAKYGDVDAVWKLSLVTDYVLRLDCTDNRLPIVEKTIVMERRDQPQLHHSVQAEGKLAAYGAVVDQIITKLDELGAPADTGRDRAKDMLHHYGVRASNAAYSEAIRQRKLRYQAVNLEGEE